MKTISIINASDSELAPFLAALPDTRKTERAMLTFYTGQYHGHTIVTLYSGVGKVNAALAAQVLLDSFGADAIISAGTCGGLREDIEIFDTIGAAACTYHDQDPEIITDFHPWLKTPYFQSDPVLFSQLQTLETPYPLRFGTIATGEYFLEDPIQRASLLARYPNVLGVDMESAAIAHVCYVNRTPFIAIRTATDNGRQSGAGTFEENVDKAAAISAEICLKLIEKI